jgi:hypothetical protein
MIYPFFVLSAREHNKFPRSINYEFQPPIVKHIIFSMYS